MVKIESKRTGEKIETAPGQKSDYRYIWITSHAGGEGGCGPLPTARGRHISPLVSEWAPDPAVFPPR